MAHPDLDQIVNTAMDQAQQLLEKHGEFYPFAVAIHSSDGKLQMYGAYSGEERPPSQTIIDMLLKGFRSEAAAGKLTATGICLDVRVIPPQATEKTDAIAVWLEHVNGEAVDVALPYRKTNSGEFEYGELFAIRGGHGIFSVPNKQ